MENTLFDYYIIHKENYSYVEIGLNTIKEFMDIQNQNL